MRPLFVADKPMFDATVEFQLNRAVDYIKMAQQVHKRELDKKDDIIQSLQKKIEDMQYQVREFSESKRRNDQETRELLYNNQVIREQLSQERVKNEHLREDLSRLTQNLASYEDKIAHLESEHDKANHIIKNLLKKVQGSTSKQPLQQQQSHLPQNRDSYNLQQAPLYHSQQPLMQPRAF